MGHCFVNLSLQVRFSSNLPPTRQSRFGPNDGERVQFHSPNNATLAKGSVAETGFRRRQVSKLMNLQTDPHQGRRSLPPRHHSMDAQMYTSERIRVSENSNSTAFHYLLIRYYIHFPYLLIRYYIHFPYLLIRYYIHFPYLLISIYSLLIRYIYSVSFGVGELLTSLFSFVWLAEGKLGIN